MLQPYFEFDIGGGREIDVRVSLLPTLLNLSYLVCLIAHINQHLNRCWIKFRVKF